MQGRKVTMLEALVPVDDPFGRFQTTIKRIIPPVGEYVPCDILDHGVLVADSTFLPFSQIVRMDLAAQDAPVVAQEGPQEAPKPSGRRRVNGRFVKA